MKAVFFPVGDKNRASSRYRVHNVVSARKDFQADSRDWRNANVLVFQRALERRHFDIAREGKANGKLIILDISDFYFYRHRWKRQMGAVKKMARIAHCLTASNEDDAAEIETVLKKRTYVIPGAQKASKHHRKHSDVPVPTVVWIGRQERMDHVLGSIWPVFQRLSGARVPFRLMIINDLGTHGFYLPFSQIEAKRWSRGMVYPTIARCDVGVCPQVKQTDGRYHKDGNTAVTMWMCGVPCVAFNRTKDWYGDLYKFLTDWRFRASQGRKGIERAKAWLPENVAKKWQKIMQKEIARLK